MVRRLSHEEMKQLINPEDARIFRIVHRDNVAWILKNGVHCRNSPTFCARYVNIGNADLIAKREEHAISVGGTLHDYVPFYFTPFSPMAMNINTGFRGVTRRRNSEIVILVSSVDRVIEAGCKFAFADRHAYMEMANFFTRKLGLKHIDWGILQRRDFARDQNDLGKMDRYQAEFLIRGCLPITALRAIVCYDEEAATPIRKIVKSIEAKPNVLVKPELYF